MNSVRTSSVATTAESTLIKLNLRGGELLPMDELQVAKPLASVRTAGQSCTSRTERQGWQPPRGAMPASKGIQESFDAEILAAPMIQLAD